MTRGRPRIAALVAAATLACLLAGCAPAEPGSPPGPASPPHGSEPVFSGPWGGLFASTYAEADEVEREALADGEISDAEYAYFQGAIVDCLDGIGFEASFTDAGALQYSGTGVEEKQEDINACNLDNGVRVLALRDAIRRNPDNLDESGIMVDCLKRLGVVADDYTRDMFESGVEIARILDDEGFDACNADPLHAGIG